jgi:hypothetical protein
MEAPGSPWTEEYGYNPNALPDATKIAVSQEDAHSASNSVKISGGGSDPWVFYATPPGETFYVRVWFKVVTPSAQGVLIGVGPISGHGDEIRLRLREGKVTLNSPSGGDGLNPDPSNCTDCVSTPADWFCAQMFYDGTTDTARLWIDGTLAAEVVNNTGWHSGGSFPAVAERVWFGTLDPGGTPPTLFVDDIAVGLSQIACN